MAETSLTELKARKLETEIRLGEAQILKTQADSRTSSIQAEAHELEMKLERAGNVYARTLSFIGEIGYESGLSCADAITKWSRINSDPITVTLNSPGGNVIAGLALIDTIEELQGKGQPITIVVRGWAASMGGIILQAASHRVVGKNAYIMLHESSLEVGGKMSDISESVAFAERLQGRCLDLLASRSSLTAKQIKAKWDGKKDWWLSAEECLELGFCDEIG